MSSSNVVGSTGSTITISATSPTTGYSSYTIGAVNTILDASTIQSAKEPIEQPAMVLAVEKGEPTLCFYETENHQRVRMVLEPDAGMSVAEQLKINLMMQVMKESPLRMHFSPLAYIRSHNLERHFRFST